MARIPSCGALLFVLLALVGGAEAHEGHKPVEERRTGGTFAFVPKPGTYQLPAVKRAAGGPVLDERGRAHDLADLLSGRITVLAFIYTRCGDACPTANLQMSLLQDLAAKTPALSGRVRLISMSFDPDYDRADVMAELAAQWRSADSQAPEWLFLTGRDGQTLAPTLAAYNQSVSVKPAQSPSGPLSHIFRAFLIDREGRVRNIYSLDFFEPDLVLADLQTLLIDDRASAQVNRWR